MYETFFGLHGEPFSVAPDPRFMYLSDPHREALKHLEIGLRGAGGFVLLTGEIGAGKTTVWRSFLEQLPSNFDVATVVNPRLGVDALLARLCDDLGVELTDGVARDPIDALHGHLLLAHAQGRRTLIAVDEAQALSDEVLEQLRLLTNLVTSDRKLLQVLLIGQPELLDMLERPALEPLAQRVVARYHLPALTEDETRRYIAHRLAVAGTGGVLPFDDPALQHIHRHCGGVPRRINVLCDRALLSAWQAKQPRVDAERVDQVASEVFGRPRKAGDTVMAAVPAEPALPPPAPAAPQEAAADPRAVWVMAGIALLVGLLLSPWLRSWLAGPPPVPAAVVAPIATPQVPPATSLVAPREVLAAPALAPSPVAVAAPDDLPLGRRDEAEAWRELGGLFGLRLGAGDPCEQVRALGWLCFRGNGGVAQLRQLDRPAWLGLTDAAGRRSQVLVVGLNRSTAMLRVAGQPRSVSLDRLARDWQGGVATLWQPPPGYQSGQVVPDDGSELAGWVASRLSAFDASPDRPLGQRVLAFQLARGLDPDGLVGPQTLMALHRAAGGEAPRLSTP
jgi:general secretion pathway protein A